MEPFMKVPQTPHYHSAVRGDLISKLSQTSSRTPQSLTRSTTRKIHGYRSKEFRHEEQNQGPEVRRFLATNHVETHVSDVLKTRTFTHEHYHHLSSAERAQVVHIRNEVPEVPDPPSSAELTRHRKDISHELIFNTSPLFPPELVRTVRATQLSRSSPDEIGEVIREKFLPIRDPNHPALREVYGNIYNPDKSPQALYEENVAKRKRQHEFLTQLNAITTQPPPLENEADLTAAEKKEAQRKAVLKELETFIYKEPGNIGIFNAAELRTLLIALWNLGGHSEIVEFVLATKDPVFLSTPENLILFGQSIMKSKEYYNPFVSIEIANLLESFKQEHGELFHFPSENIDMLLAVANALRNDDAANLLEIVKDKKKSEEALDAALANYARAFPTNEGGNIIEEDYQREIELNYLNSLSLTLHHYKKAFEANFDPRLGLRYMHKCLQSKEAEDAQRAAELIQLSCLRDGVPFSNNFAIIRAALEAAYVAPIGPILHFIPKLEAQLVALCKSEKEIENALHSLMDLKRIHKSAKIDDMIQKIKNHRKEIAGAGDNAEEVIKKRQLEAEAIKLPFAPETVAWNERTYSYSGLTSNYITGSLIAAGGQSPSQLINQGDQEFFAQLIEVPLGKLMNHLPPDLAKKIDPKKSLHDVEDPKLFLELVDHFLRLQFNTDKWHLENLHSKGHQVFDETMIASIKLTGVNPAKHKAALRAERRPSSLPEVMVDNTNLSMNLVSRLGDCRQHAQCKQMIFDTWRQYRANDALRDLDNARSNEANHLADAALQRFQNVSRMQLRIWDMKVVGQPEGHHIWERIEDHTTNVLLTYNERGEVADVAIADSFYQTVYPFQMFSLNFASKNPHSDIYPTGVSITHEGEQKQLAVRSSARAGSREKYAKDNQNYWIGLPHQRFSVQDMITQRETIEHRNTATRRWARETS